MLKFINESLFSYGLTSTKDKKSGKEYSKIKVLTANTILVSGESEGETRMPNKNCKVVPSVGTLVPLNREILRISTPVQNLVENEVGEIQTPRLDFPMSINVQSKNGHNQVEIRCHENGPDHCNAFIIAFPFNGMIRPLEADPKYRIYRGMIASSAKPFYFNGRRYRKILYLVVEINKNLFNPDHKYHTDSVDLTLESFALFTDRDTLEQKTNCEKCTIRFTDGEGTYTADWEYSTEDRAILMNTADTPLWHTYSFDKGGRREIDNTAEAPRKTRKNPHPVTYEGGMRVTTNRHGIRKEEPFKKSGNKRRYDKAFDDDGDQMCNDRHGNRGRGKGGKKRR